MPVLSRPGASGMRIDLEENIDHQAIVMSYVS